jgi:hypothetical protein
MSERLQPCSPGSHPHADQPNWRLADNPWDYARNCQEGLETFSERHFAKLFGISRAELWRWRLMANLSDDLFEALLKAPGIKASSKSLAAAALLLERGPYELTEAAGLCPHCGGVLRVRLRAPREYIRIIARWVCERERCEREIAP